MNKFSVKYKGLVNGFDFRYFSLFCFIFFCSLSIGNVLYSTYAENSSQLNESQFGKFNFVAAGDYGCDSNANRTITNMVAKEPEVVIGLGDLSYQKTADCWFEIVSPLDDGRIKIVIGDNEVYPAKLAQYINHFKIENPFYSFDYGNVHFLSMATAKNKMIPYNETSEQYKFVKDDLRKAYENKSINWIIVNSYRPFYSSNTTHPGSEVLQDLYHQLFEKYGVDIVLQAHNQNYQRTYPISYNEKRNFSPVVTDKETSKYTNDPEGVIFITAGTGGKDLYNFTSQAPYVVTQFKRHGFLNVDLNYSNNVHSLTGTFFENRKMNAEDQFSIVKK